MHIQNFGTSSFHLREMNSAWRTVLHLGVQQKVQKSFLWHSGKDDTFSFIDKGCVRLECMNTAGRHRIIFSMESGCLFRDISIFSKSTNFTSTLVAMEESIIYNFPSSLIFDRAFICQYPELMSNLVTSLSQKGGALFSLLAEKNEQVPDEVICRYIEKLADKYGANTFNPNISQVDLALSVGMHRSTVCRVIKSLRMAGILGTFSKHKLEITDRKKLQMYCSGKYSSK